MKKILSLLCLVSAISFAADKGTVIKSSISKVTVYQQGAQIQQKATYSVQKGITTLILEGISPSIDPNSIQINATGSIVLLESKYTIHYPEPDPVENPNNEIPVKIQKEISLLQDSLFELEYEIATIQNQIDVLNSEKRIIENNGTIKGQGKVNDSIPLLKDALLFYHEKMNQINKELLSLNRQKYLLAKKQTRMQTRLNELYNYNANNNLVYQQNMEPIHRIEVTISAEEAATGKIEATYLANNAGWVPMYDFRSTASTNSIELTYKAHVYQNTGIDWNDVKLSLSTNNPYANKTKPELQPWYLDYYTYYGNYDDQQKKTYSTTSGNLNGYGTAMPSLSESSISTKDGEEYTDAETSINYSTMISHLLSVEYAIDLPYSIKSDNQKNMVLINTKSLNTDYLYYAVPKLDLSVYMVARITNLGELNLVPGKANLFHDGAYIGETYLNPSTLEDTMNISLGKDQNIVVSRTLMKDESKEKVVGDKIEKTVSYHITIKNQKAKNIRLIMQDQLPISRNSEIEVEVIDISKGITDPITGITEWNMRMKPSESQTVNLVYTVKYDKTKNVNLAYY
ncbi:MAG: DUF4139 domain-containing protein [Crocinitomicaceae bacterium]|nr:DUF4139 domain-containing protein [Crocinitomicaceae bacterium]MBK8926781.1 DUF4139 domain-containing protein [Crocinitomicaceae bacterium]